MKKILKYGIYAEDKAGRCFLEQIIPQLLVYQNSEIILEHCTAFSNEYLPKSVENLMHTYIEVLVEGYKPEYQLDICFLIRDSDDEIHSGLYKDMYQNLSENGFSNKTIIAIPVQAIEYWLWYLKAQKEGLPIIAKEKEGRKELKLQVYKRKRCNNKDQIEIISQLVQYTDIDFLSKNSASFKHFVDEFKTTLSKN